MGNRLREVGAALWLLTTACSRPPVDGASGDDDGTTGPAPVPDLPVDPSPQWPPPPADLLESKLDLPDGPPMCDYWDPIECAGAEKCVPSALPTGEAWMFHECLPAGQAAVGASCCSNVYDGDDCRPDGHLYADSCDESGWCTDHAGGGHTGTCRELCGGTPESATCTSTAERCVTRRWLDHVCRPTCDPLAADACDEGDVCAVLPGPRGQESPVSAACVPQLVFEVADVDGECWDDYKCAAGLDCVDAEVAGPTCAHYECCTELCDLEDPDFGCAGPDQLCLPLFPPEDPLYGHLGRCEFPG